MTYNCHLKKINTITGNYEQGEMIFKKECASCHSTNLKNKLIGPPLFEITKKKPIPWLIKWIKNNKKLRLSGDKEANKIYKEYDNIEMNNFEHLSNTTINDLLFYIDTWDQNKDINTKNKNIQKNQHTEFTSNNNESLLLKKTITIGFICISVILLLILYKIYQLLTLINIKTFKEYRKLKNKHLHIIIIKLMKLIIHNKMFIFIMITFCSILSIYKFWYFLMNIDVNTGYQPQQPIYFSHKIHSKINNIHCIYCHYNAKYGKYADIPSISLCMNCHNQITEYKGEYIELNKSKEFYNQEINKIYKYVGWDKTNNTYTNKPKPIKWIKLHNMPDFVYFNHYQHVIIGGEKIKQNKNVKISCYACHGVVENMNEIKITNDLTMGWCIKCHRTTEIDINNYYYKKFYNNLINQKKKITVDKVGGLECNKCHY
jgi:hypothetical protein